MTNPYPITPRQLDLDKLSGSHLTQQGVYPNIKMGVVASYDVSGGSAETVLKSTASGGLTLGSLNVQGNAILRNVLPENTDTYDLGSSTNLWRKGWLSELDTVIFAENTASLIGGWLIIGKNQGSIPSFVDSTDTTIDFGKTMIVGGSVVFRSSLQVEYIGTGSLASGSTVYNVVRDLDGSGANDWVEGSAFLVLGESGDGRIELNAYDSPRMSILEQGATYNSQTERIRVGDLAAWQGAGFTGYGIAIGNYSGGESLVYSPTGGLEVRGTIKADDGYLKNLTVQGLLSLNTLGELRAGDTTNGLRLGYLTDGYYLRGVGGGVTQVEIKASDGKLYAGGGQVKIDQYGIQLPITSGSLEPQSPQAITWYRSAFQSSYIGVQYSSPRTTLALSAGQHGDSYGLISLMAHRNGASPNEALSFKIDAYNMTAKLYSLNSLGNGVLEIEGDLIVDDKFGYGYGNITFDGALKSHKNSTNYTGYIFVPLVSPLTSTSWDGDARSAAGKTLIDLSAVFGVPAGVKAVNIKVSMRDSGSAAGSAGIVLSPNATAWSGKGAQVSGIRNDAIMDFDLVVPCNANGDIYYQTYTSGAGTLDVWLQIWGYWI